MKGALVAVLMVFVVHSHAAEKQSNYKTFQNDDFMFEEMESVIDKIDDIINDVNSASLSSKLKSLTFDEDFLHQQESDFTEPENPNMEDEYKDGSEMKLKINIKMPQTTISEDDTYLCTTVKLSKYNAEKPLYIVEYIPHAIESVAHHMLLFGCTEAGSTTSNVWNCGGKMHGSKKQSYAPTCLSGENILWAWAKDAPSFHLPSGVGFQVGANTNIKYLTLQAHFKSKVAANEYGINRISVTAVATIQPQPNIAGIYILASSDGSVKPHSTQDMDIVCRYQGRVVMHPFAYRTHTHALGRMVYGYRVRNEKWTIIGRKNPQKPEAFYPVENNLSIRRGDWLAARCAMKSNRNHTTYIGATHKDEMCNFYIMYWTPRFGTKGSLLEKSCENGYSFVHWSHYFLQTPHTL